MAVLCCHVGDRYVKVRHPVETLPAKNERLLLSPQFQLDAASCLTFYWYMQVECIYRDLWNIICMVLNPQLYRHTAFSYMLHVHLLYTSCASSVV